MSSLPAGRLEVAGEQLGVERRLRQQHAHRAVPRIQRDDRPDLSGHRGDRFRLQLEVDGGLQRATGHRRLLVERRHLLAERVHDDDDVAGSAAEHVLVRALESRSGPRAGPIAGRGWSASCSGDTSPSWPTRCATVVPVGQRPAGRGVDLELAVLGAVRGDGGDLWPGQVVRDHGGQVGSPARLVETCRDLLARRDVERRQERRRPGAVRHLLREEQELVGGPVVEDDLAMNVSDRPPRRLERQPAQAIVLGRRPPAWPLHDLQDPEPHRDERKQDAHGGEQRGHPSLQRAEVIADERHSCRSTRRRWRAGDRQARHARSPGGDQQSGGARHRHGGEPAREGVVGPHAECGQRQHPDRFAARGGQQRTDDPVQRSLHLEPAHDRRDHEPRDRAGDPAGSDDTLRHHVARQSGRESRPRHAHRVEAPGAGDHDDEDRLARCQHPPEVAGRESELQQESEDESGGELHGALRVPGASTSTTVTSVARAANRTGTTVKMPSVFASIVVPNRSPAG